jgi:hypothetical protein
MPVFQAFVGSSVDSRRLSIAGIYGGVWSGISNALEKVWGPGLVIFFAQRVAGELILRAE